MLGFQQISILVGIILNILITSAYATTENDAKFKTAGVVTNGYECSTIGGDILRKGGSAADAAIAALFCDGVTVPHGSGLGGGSLFVIYKKATGKVETLNSREVAPIAASTNMYNRNSTLARKGGLSVAVPGELIGYWELHQKYGILPWRELVQPTIDLCRKGHLVTKYLADVWKYKEREILHDPPLRDVYIDPKTNETWKEGEYVKRMKFADMLEVIAKEGANALYNGSLTKSFVEDIKEKGGIITEEDMHRYRPVWHEPIVTRFENHNTLYTVPVPGSGVILSFILNVLDGYLDENNLNSIVNWQKIVETFKYAYGIRTVLGDPNFEEGMETLMKNVTSESYAEVIKKLINDKIKSTSQDPHHYGANYYSPDDHGTVHLSVLAPNGDAVSVSSTINSLFGAKFASKSTDIVLNNEMDDFSSPHITNSFQLQPSPPNFIKPGKRPLSSMCPTIIVDKNGDVRMVVGAAGGIKTITSVASVISMNMWFGESLKDSVNEKKLHHQLIPMTLQYEEGFNQDIVDKLAAIGHKTQSVKSTSYSAVTAISKENGTIVGQWDVRRQGSIDIF